MPQGSGSPTSGHPYWPVDRLGLEAAISSIKLQPWGKRVASTFSPIEQEQGFLANRTENTNAELDVTVLALVSSP